MKSWNISILIYSFNIVAENSFVIFVDISYCRVSRYVLRSSLRWLNGNLTRMLTVASWSHFRYHLKILRNVIALGSWESSYVRRLSFSIFEFLKVGPYTYAKLPFASAAALKVAWIRCMNILLTVTATPPQLELQRFHEKTFQPQLFLINNETIGITIRSIGTISFYSPKLLRNVTLRKP